MRFQKNYRKRFKKQFPPMNLKTLLVPYIETEDKKNLKEIILRALEASPTPEDQDYAKELRAK